MKEKIKNWWKSQTKEIKIILLITLILHLSAAIYRFISEYLYILSYGLDSFMGRLLGLFLGTTMPVFLIAATLGLIPYFLFREVAERYKRYFDYFVITFLIITIIILYFGTFHRPF